MEANQKLNGGIAAQMITEVSPLVNGKVDTAAIQDIMHSMMVINPSVEVYLLNTEGDIITYVAPYKKVVLDKVDLQPIHRFIADGEDRKGCYLGDDPRSFDQQKVFSAAAIEENGKRTGYIYIILASEDRTSVMSSLYGNYFLKNGTILFFLSLLTALALGGLLLWFLTKNLRVIFDSVRRFRDGDYESRIPLHAAGDLKDFAGQFNDMADKVVENFDHVKRLENLRRELIANVSHDLRTPLSIIQGYSETLLIKEDKLSKEEKNKYLNVIYKSTENLSKQVNQLFELSKLEAREVLPEKEPFSIADLVNDIVLKNKLAADAKQITLDMEVKKNLPLVFADLAMVERVFQNLLDNALRYTPEGGNIRIMLSPSSDKIICTLTDNGIGISEADQKLIFDRYKRSAEKIKMDKSAGAGLGLAIVKKILELHESTITVKSKLNEGTSFVFHLPAHFAS